MNISLSHYNDRITAWLVRHERVVLWGLCSLALVRIFFLQPASRSAIMSTSKVISIASLDFVSGENAVGAPRLRFPDIATALRFVAVAIAPASLGCASGENLDKKAVTQSA